MDKKEVEKQGVKIFTIGLSARNTTPADVERNLEQFIRENEGGKYIFSLEYDRQIPYAQYIESVDMVFNVVYRFRKELSMRKFQVPYDKLGDELQKEMRKAYPMVLSEAWSGR
jgi:endo-alpha-1,4-polygalactosaminidase (GH114 family)